jgi:acetyl esterase/lipase
MARKIELNPELKFRGTMIKTFTPPLGKRGVKLMYKLTSSMRGRHGKSLRYEQIFIPRSDGTQLRICVYSPFVPKSGAPGLLWIHGGGYSIGVPEQDESAYIKRFIDAGTAVVVAPDYTKSVVKPYPAALEDCYAALLWLRDNGERYGMRSDQIFTGGDSAGGGLTAAVSLYARDKGEAAIAFQMPLYPMIDDRPTLSNTDNHAPLWDSRSNDIAWRMYLGELYGSIDVPAYAAPARAGDYKNLPPTLTFVGSIEPFHSETVEYIRNLQQSGVPTHFKVFDGGFHAFDMVCPKAGISKEAAELIMTSFRYATRHYFAKQPIGDQRSV